MWILRSASASPFVRKVRIAAAICGLDDRIKIEVADTTDPTDSLRRQNPLGKIPALILEDGTVLYDSAVIVDFLDAEAGGGVIIPKGSERFRVLTMQALADGMKEAAVLKVYEGRFRAPETAQCPLARAPDRQDRARARDLRGGAAVAVRQARYRPDRPRLRARLSRSALRRNMARNASASRRLARRFRCPSSELRGDAAELKTQKRKPGNTPGLSLSLRWNAYASELDADAAANRVRVEIAVDRRAAEIEVFIKVVGEAVLDARGDVVEHLSFDASARRPAPKRLLVAACGRAQLEIGSGATGGSVEQEAVERDTGAAAERSVQTLLGFDAAARRRRGTERARSPSAPTTKFPHCQFAPA